MNKNTTLILLGSIIVAIGFPILLWIIPCTNQFISDTLDLEFIHILGICSAGVSIYWTSIRYNQTHKQLEYSQEQLVHSQKQLAQAEDFQKLSKLNELYSTLIRELGAQASEYSAHNRNKEKPEPVSFENRISVCNLINAISSALSLYYPDKEAHTKYTRQVLNFENMLLRGVDLSNTVLRKANLEKAYLREADLLGADLQNADLQTAILRNARLAGTILKEANLKEANLREADLLKANLKEADLREADLRGANLEHADLSEADLRGAKLKEAIIFDSVWRGAKISISQKPYIEAHIIGSEQYNQIEWIEDNKK